MKDAIQILLLILSIAAMVFSVGYLIYLICQNHSIAKVLDAYRHLEHFERQLVQLHTYKAKLNDRPEGPPGDLIAQVDAMISRAREARQTVASYLKQHEEAA